MSRPLQPGSLPNIRAKHHWGPLEVRYESFALINVHLILLFRIAPFEYTEIKSQQDWIFAIKLIYKNMLQEYRLYIFLISKNAVTI